MSLPPPPPPMPLPPPGLGGVPGALPAPVTVPPSPRRGLGRALGVMLIVGGLSIGVLSAAAALAAPRAAVGKFARARAGCTTTLKFDRTGTFTLYLETKGRLAGTGGDCASGTYEAAGSAPPSVTIGLVDPSGKSVATDATPARHYDVGAYRGDALARVTIRERGDYELTVGGSNVDVAVAVGGDPFADQRLWGVIGIVVTVLGTLLGATVVLMNRR